MGSVNQEIGAGSAKKRSKVVEWLNNLFPDFNMPLDASEEELRAQLHDGVILCAILNRKSSGSVQSQRGVFISSEQRLYNLRRFLAAMDEMGLPRFNVSDLEQGSLSAIVACLLSLRDHMSSGMGGNGILRDRMSSGIGDNGIYDADKSGSQSRNKWNLSQGDRLETVDLPRRNHRQIEPNSPVLGDGRKRSSSESKFLNLLRNHAMSDTSTVLLPPGGHKFHEVFQLNQGRYSDLPAARISEMMKSNSLDNAPTQSLLSVVNGILDESIERKNGEIPHRVACLLRKVVQEIERRISTQADHIRSQNNLIKAREERYQSKIRVLETLASGTSEETQIVSDQLQKIKIEKTKVEVNRKHGDQDMDILMREKEKSDNVISKLKKELETVKNLYDNRIQQLERNSDVDKLIREKENSDHVISELKQELESMTKSYESRCQRFDRNSDMDNRLMKEKENSDHKISELKQELDSVKRLYESRLHQFERNPDMDCLSREKENSDHVISELKKELESMKKSYERRCQQSDRNSDMDIVIKEKENSDHKISELKQELESMKMLYEGRHQQFEGNPDMDSLTGQKGNSDNVISELKQELKSIKKLSESGFQKSGRDSDMDKLIKEKENSDHKISELKQELDNVKRLYEGHRQQFERNPDMDSLTREKENSDIIISRLKQELDNVKESYEKQELENAKAYEIRHREADRDSDIDRLTSDKEISENTISELKQELENVKNRCQQLERDSEMSRLTKEKENIDNMQLKQELENVKNSYEKCCQQFEKDTTNIKIQLEERIKDTESLLIESRNKAKELEELSESNLEKWCKKELVFQKFVGCQLHSIKSMRVSSESIKQEVIKIQEGWSEEMTSLGVKLKVVVNAAESYQTVLAENWKLYNEIQELKGNIRVYCRVRPFLPGQNAKSTTVDYIGDKGEVLIVNPTKQGKDGRRMFKFNKAFGPSCTQEEVYLDVQPLIRSVLDGYNVCIFAYGQTGSGKTYTMSGPNSPTKEEWGVNYRALNDLFNISRSRSSTFLYEIGVQMVEIYNEQVRDLLTNNSSQRSLGILSSSQNTGVAVPDATMLPVNSTSDVVDLMQFGQSNRAMHSTALNERSSRSHSVVTVHVRGEDLKAGSSSRGCLHLIDLAGSERVDRSEVTGDRLKEAQHINKSLSALGDVIFALAQKNNHVPYRNSKLTQVLQSSLGGHAKTLMFVQVNPDIDSYSETVGTLKFAERVSGVELGAARSNKEGKDVKDLMEQVASLKDTIAKKDGEIDELQLLKDVKAGSSGSSNLLRHSSSFSGVSSTGRHSRRSNSGREAKFTEKGASDPENSSEISDRQSESSSQQSIDDLKHQKENFSYSDVEERLSDVSDGGNSIGAETDSPKSEVSLPEAGKRSKATTEKIPRVPLRTPRLLPQRPGPTAAARPKLKDPLKSPVMKKSTTGQTTTSSARAPLRR